MKWPDRMGSASARWMIMGGIAVIAMGIFLAWSHFFGLSSPLSPPRPESASPVKGGEKGAMMYHGFDRDRVAVVSKKLKLGDNVVKRLLAIINENKNERYAKNAVFEELAATWSDLRDRVSRRKKDDPWAAQVAEHLDNGRLDEAGGVIMEAVKRDEKTIEKPGKETAQKFFYLAEISELTLDDQTAIQRWQRALDLMPGDISAWRNLARAHERMGDGPSALLAWQYMYVQAQDQGDISQQARALSGEASQLARGGRIDSALSKYMLARGLFEISAREDPENIQWQRELSALSHRIGEMHNAGGNGANAIAAYEDGLNIFYGLARKDPDHPQWQRGLSASHNKIGDMFKAAGEIEKAMTAYESSLKILKRMVLKNPENSQWQRDLSVSYNKMGDMLKASGDAAKAMDAYTNSLNIFQSLVRRDPENHQWQRDLSVGHNKIGDIRKAGGEIKKAIEAYKKGLAIRRVMAREYPDRVQYQTDLATSFYRLSTLIPDQRRQFLTDALNILVKERDQKRLTIEYQVWIEIIQKRLALENNPLE